MFSVGMHEFIREAKEIVEEFWALGNLTDKQCESICCVRGQVMKTEPGEYEVKPVGEMGRPWAVVRRDRTIVPETSFHRRKADAERELRKVAAG